MLKLESSITVQNTECLSLWLFWESTTS